MSSEIKVIEKPRLLFFAPLTVKSRPYMEVNIMRLSKGLVFSAIGACLGGLIGALFEDLSTREYVKEEVERQLQEKEHEAKQHKRR